MRKQRGTLLIIFGILLIFAAVGLVSYNLWDDKRAAESIGSIMSSLDNQGKNDSNAIPDYILNPEMDMPTIEIDGYKYIGTVEIPALDLKLPVMDSWSYPKMKIAPCRYSGSAYLNNMVICAHNYTSHFGRLRNVHIGDEIVFTDVANNVFHYYAGETEILQRTAVEEMTVGDWDLTRFTCTVGARARFAVRCVLIEE